MAGVAGGGGDRERLGAAVSAQPEAAEGLKVTAHAAASTHQIPQGLQGPHPWQGQGLARSSTSARFGLKAVEPERLTARQIEAARRAITRAMKRAGRVWIRIFPDVPVTKKPAEVRMGSGKGAPELWVARVKPGRIMFELDGVTRRRRARRLQLGAAKLPIKTRIVKRQA